MTTSTTAETPCRLTADAVSLGYGTDPVITRLSTRIPDHRITVIVGANACGKSTLLRGLARLLRPASGAIRLDGTAICALPTRQVARTLGILPQNPVAPDGLRVAELVARGRYPHRRALRRRTQTDHEVVTHALDLTGCLDLAERYVADLSGGQCQRVWIAMALAQQTDLLLLDEPTTYLDVSHQIEVLDLLAGLNERQGTTVVMVLHDLNLAARYADHLIAMADGTVVATGDPESVINRDCVRTVFGIDSRIVEDPVSHTPMVIPESPRDRRQP